MNPRKLIAAMLGATACSLGRFVARKNPRPPEPGRPQRDPIKAIDVAGAVGAAHQHDPLAVDVLCLLWWGEWSQHRSNVEPLLDLLAHRMRIKVITPTGVKDTKIARSRTSLARTRTRSGEKPLEAEDVPRMVEAAIREIHDPSKCDNCAGYGELWSKAKTAVVGCDECGGRGTLAASDNRRSRLIGCRRSDYVGRFKDAYEAIHSDIRKLEAQGAHLVYLQLDSVWIDPEAAMLVVLETMLEEA